MIVFHSQHDFPMLILFDTSVFPFWRRTVFFETLLRRRTIDRMDLQLNAGWHVSFKKALLSFLRRRELPATMSKNCSVICNDSSTAKLHDHAHEQESSSSSLPSTVLSS